MLKHTLRFLFLFLALTWAGTLYYLSAQPGLGIPPIFSYQDKFLHFTAFGLLGFLAMGCLRTHEGSYRKWQVWLIVLLVGLYGMSDEFHQNFVAGRDASMYDLAADLAGGMFGAWVMYYLLNVLSAASSGLPHARE